MSVFSKIAQSPRKHQKRKFVESSVTSDGGHRCAALGVRLPLPVASRGSCKIVECQLFISGSSHYEMMSC